MSNREKRKLDGNWKSKIKGLCRVLERELGPETQDELSSRKELREKLFELGLVIYSIQGLKYWNTRLPSLLQMVMELVDAEWGSGTSWSRELWITALELQAYGRRQNHSPLANSILPHPEQLPIE
jgi:hypothetical protein